MATSSRNFDARASEAIEEPIGKVLARAAGGAIFFALPLLLTMEMWWLGFAMDRFRLGLLMLLMVPLLIGLSHIFRWTAAKSWAEAARQGLIAYGIGLAVSAVILLLIGVVGTSIGGGEFLGKIAVQSVPASIGAVIGANQFAPKSADDGKSRRATAGYGSELFLTAVGALYLGITVAPTEEIILVASKMTYAHAVALALTTLFVVHILVYSIDFRRRHLIPAGTPVWSYFFRFTVMTYAASILVSAFVLWLYGRLDSTSLGSATSIVMVLAFPAGLGAAAARLIL